VSQPGKDTPALSIEKHIVLAHSILSLIEGGVKITDRTVGPELRGEARNYPGGDFDLAALNRNAAAIDDLDHSALVERHGPPSGIPAICRAVIDREHQRPDVIFP